MQRRGSPAVDRGRLYLSIRSARPDEQSECRSFLSTCPQRHPALFLRGGWGRKKPESMGYGSFYSRKIWHLPEKNLGPTNGVSLRTELFEQDLGVLQVGGIETLGERALDVRDQLKRERSPARGGR
jgi:hypothetical protein